MVVAWSSVVVVVVVVEVLVDVLPLVVVVVGAGPSSVASSRTGGPATAKRCDPGAASSTARPGPSAVAISAPVTPVGSATVARPSSPVVTTSCQSPARNVTGRAPMPPPGPLSRTLIVPSASASSVNSHGPRRRHASAPKRNAAASMSVRRPTPTTCTTISAPGSITAPPTLRRAPTIAQIATAIPAASTFDSDAPGAR